MSDRLFKQSGSRYWYGWYYDVNGVRRKVSLKTESKALARKKLRTREQLADDPTPHQTAQLGDALRYYLDVVMAGRSEGTRDSYTKKAGHIRRVLDGKTRCGDLDRTCCQEYIAQRIDEQASTSTIAKELTVLRQTLKAQDIAPSFVPSVKVRYVPGLRYLTRTEFDLLCANVSQRMRTFLHLTCLGGMRAGEAMAVRWLDVNWDADLLNVPQGKTRGRPLPLVMGDGAATELREFLVRCIEMRARRSSKDDGVAPRTQELCPALTNLICGKFSYYKELNRRAKQLKLEPVCANDLRRTFASWMKQAGVDSAVVAEMMGNSARMIDLVYGKLDMESKRRAMSKLPPRPALTRVK